MQIQTTQPASESEVRVDETQDVARDDQLAMPATPVEDITRLSPMTPPVDILEHEDGLVLVADLPGVTAENVQLDLDRQTLRLAARDERRARIYRRAFVVPATLDPDRIEATLERGVLRLMLPKRDEAKPRRIEVRTS